MGVVSESKAQVNGVEESQKLDYHYLEVLGDVKDIRAFGSERMIHISVT